MKAYNLIALLLAGATLLSGCQKKTNSSVNPATSTTGTVSNDTTNNPVIVKSSWVKVNDSRVIYLSALQTFGAYLIGGSGTAGGGSPAYTTLSVSKDNGRFWESSSSGINNAFVWSIFFHQNYIFAGTSKGIYRSADNGASWVQVNNSLGKTDNKTSVVFTSLDNKLFVANIYWGIAVSYNNGDIWTLCNNGLPSGTNNIIGVIAMHHTGNTLFAGLSNGCYRSTDNGNTWEQVNEGLDNTFTQAFASSGNKVFAVPNNAGIYVSTNNGTSWAPSNTGLGRTDIVKILVSGNNTIALSRNKGVFLSLDAGRSWTSINDGLPAEAVTLRDITVNGSTLIASTGTGHIYNYKL